MYYSYDYEDGIEFHDTAEAAKARAESALDDARDHACDSGWNEEEWQISWGKVMGVARETERKKAPDDSEFEEIVDFQIIDPSNDKMSLKKGD